MTGVDGRTYTSDQATIWRWRTAFQNDFAARMDWTIKAPAQANHNPEVVVNGQAGKAPLRIDATVGVPLTLDAGASRDPDNHVLKFDWFFYPRPAPAFPASPYRRVVSCRSVGEARPAKAAYRRGRKADRASRPRGWRFRTPPPPARRSCRASPARRTSSWRSRTTAARRLTSYRRVILTIKPK